MTEHCLHPLLMAPHLVEKIWGGTRLSACGNKLAAYHGDPSKIGESWEVADLEAGSSFVAAGPLAGQTLSDVAGQWGRALTGTASESERFPLLVKLIDASDDLSIQVHPGPDNQHRWPGAHSKDEAWIVVQTTPGASLLHGLVPDVTKAQFARALSEQGPEALLRRVEVKPGDVLHVTPGTQHAICQGVFLLEIQEPSDTTYRVWDYKRPGLDGKLRQLHVEQALDVTDFGPQTPALTEPQPLPSSSSRIIHRLLVNAPGFRIESLTTQAQAETVPLRLDGPTPLVLIPLKGAVTVPSMVKADSLVIEALHTLVLPAALGEIEIHLAANTHLVLAGLGGQALAEFRA